MANLPAPALLTTNGDYDLTGLLPGRQYFLKLSNTFGGGTVVLSSQNQATKSFENVTGGSWTAYTEQHLRCDSPVMRLTLSGATSPNLAVTFILVP